MLIVLYMILRESHLQRLNGNNMDTILIFLKLNFVNILKKIVVDFFLFFLYIIYKDRIIFMKRVYFYEDRE